MSNCDDMKDCPFCGKKPWKQRIGMSEVYAYADKVVYTCSGCGITRGAMGDLSKSGYADNSTVEARARQAWEVRVDPRIDQLKAENEKLLARDKMHIEHFNGLSEFRDRTVEGFDSKIAALEAEIEALRVDAGRYRYLRTKSIPLDGHDFLSSMEILDYRVDVAIRNKP